jgi:exosortase
MRRAELMTTAAIAVVFAPTAVALARIYTSVEYYSHGFLVPVAAGAIAFGIAKRTHAPVRPDRRGGLVLAAGLALLAVGAALGSPFWQGLALVAAIAGAVLGLRGPAWLRALAFPIAFLLFAVPIPTEWLAPVVVRLLLFVSSGATQLLQAAGVPVLREGNVMILPGGGSLFVAEACSGLTSLVTLLPIAALIAYLSPIAPRAKWLLVLLAVPIAMGANLVRVIATTLGALRWGVERAAGEPTHELLGLGVYAIACAALLLVARMLPRSMKTRRRIVRARA